MRNEVECIYSWRRATRSRLHKPMNPQPRRRPIAARSPLFDHAQSRRSVGRPAAVGRHSGRGPALRPGPGRRAQTSRSAQVGFERTRAPRSRCGAPERSRRRRRRPPGTPQCDTQSGLSGAGPRRSTAPDRRIARPGDSGPCPLRAPPGGSSLPHSRSGSPGLYLSRRPRRLRRAAPAPPFDPRRPSAARRVAVRGTAGLAAGGRAPAGAQCRPRRRPGPGRPGESQSQTGAWRRAGSGGGLR